MPCLGDRVTSNQLCQERSRVSEEPCEPSPGLVSGTYSAIEILPILPLRDPSSATLCGFRQSATQLPPSLTLLIWEVAALRWREVGVGRSESMSIRTCLLVLSPSCSTVRPRHISGGDLPAPMENKCWEALSPPLGQMRELALSPGWPAGGLWMERAKQPPKSQRVRHAR